MIISNVVVVDQHMGIGKDNKLLVHFPADLKRFKKITSGHTVIMGRKTFESMGRALPNRRNIVISRQANAEFEGAETVSSIKEALDLCRAEPEVFIIGGAEIFRQALAITDKIYITRINNSYQADTFFPELNPLEWRETEKEEYEPDQKTPFSYAFITYQRV